MFIYNYIKNNNKNNKEFKMSAVNNNNNVTAMKDKKEAMKVYSEYQESKAFLCMAAVATAVGLLAIFGCNIPSGHHLNFLKDFSNIARAQVGGHGYLIAWTIGAGAYGALFLSKVISLKYFHKDLLKKSKEETERFESRRSNVKDLYKIRQTTGVSGPGSRIINDFISEYGEDELKY